MESFQPLRVNLCLELTCSHVLQCVQSLNKSALSLSAVNSLCVWFNSLLKITNNLATWAHLQQPHLLPELAEYIPVVCPHRPRVWALYHSCPKKLTPRCPLGWWQVGGRDSAPFLEEGLQEALWVTASLVLHFWTPRPAHPKEKAAPWNQRENMSVPPGSSNQEPGGCCWRSLRGGAVFMQL